MLFWRDSFDNTVKARYIKVGYYEIPVYIEVRQCPGRRCI